MTTCRWCGGAHTVDQLCARAQRGMTRRSFCFLFGAGVTALTIPSLVPLPSPPGPLAVGMDNNTVISQFLNQPGVATFHVSNPGAFMLGQEITIDHDGMRLFAGTISEINGGQVHAVDMVSFQNRRRDVYLYSLHDL
jgi:hypothetical protein